MTLVAMDGSPPVEGPGTDGRGDDSSAGEDVTETDPRADGGAETDRRDEDSRQTDRGGETEHATDETPPEPAATGGTSQAGDPDHGGGGGGGGGDGGGGDGDGAVVPGGDGGGGGDDDDDDSGGFPIRRRTILGATALGVGSGGTGFVLGWLTGRIGRPGIRGRLSGDDRHLPFDVWGDAQATLRDTPSHLPGRGADLVERARQRHELVEESSDDGPTVRSADPEGNESASLGSGTLGSGITGTATGVTGTVGATASGSETIGTAASVTDTIGAAASATGTIGAAVRGTGRITPGTYRLADGVARRRTSPGPVLAYATGSQSGDITLGTDALATDSRTADAGAVALSDRLEQIGSDATEADEAPTNDDGADTADEPMDATAATEAVLEDLFEFVKTEIQTVPTGRSDLDDVDEVVRWGGRGALRCGMGTPRDKAEALAVLYREAGFTAMVRVTDVDVEAVGLTAEDVRADLLDPPEWIDERPDFDDELEEWADELDRDVPDAEDGAANVHDEDGAESAALAETLRAALPHDADDIGEFDWRWDASGRDTRPVPIVEVHSDDHEIYHANLFGDVPFGETGGDGAVEDPPEPDVGTVSVTLSATTPDRLGDPFELVSGEWTVPELVGRQLLVRTGSVLDPVELPMIGAGDMNAFIPSLAVQDPHASPEEQAELSEFGDMITLSGDRYGVDVEIEDGDIVVGDESVTRNGEALYDPETAADPEDIETFELAADAADFPRITLGATALDADGDHVTGLPGSAFAAAEEDLPIGLTMTHNRPRPEILYLVDISGSMNRGVDEATDEELLQGLEDLMYEVSPDATVERRDVDSAMWTHLPDAVADSPDLIVYAHDGEPAAGYDERVDPILAEAPPTLFLSAYDEGPEVEDEVVLHQAELTDGEVAPMGEWSMVRDAVESIVADVAEDVPTYRFEYEAPADGPATREVALFVGDEPVEATHDSANATYRAEDRGTNRTLVGLYLTVEHDGQEVTRTLGGWNPLWHDTWDPYSDDPDPEIGFGMPGLRDFALDTRLAMLGGVDISIEGDGVLAPVIFDDVLESRQSFRELDAVVAEAGVDEETQFGSEAHQALLETWKEGTTDVQWEPSFVQAPVPNRMGEDGLTYFLGPRMVLSQTKGTLEDEDLVIERRLDVLPTTRASTAADGTSARFDRTLERTARLSVFEDVIYEEATRSLLGDADLVERSELSDHDVSSGPYDDLRRRAGVDHRDYQLAPTDGRAVAMWNVEQDTGTVIGIMPSGAGGAVSRTHLASLAGEDPAAVALDIYMDLVQDHMCCAHASGGALGAVALYFEFLAALYARVTAIIGAMDVDATVAGTVGGAAYDVGMDQVTDHWIFDFWRMAEAVGT